MERRITREMIKTFLKSFNMEYIIIRGTEKEFYGNLGKDEPIKFYQLIEKDTKKRVSNLYKMNIFNFMNFYGMIEDLGKPQMKKRLMKVLEN